MGQKPASKETRMGLYENMGNNFVLFSPLICNNVRAIELLTTSVADEERVDSDVLRLKVVETLLKLQVFAHIATLDLSAFLRAELRTLSNPERRCNLKWVNIITYEGYKYLFGYKQDKKYGIWKKFKVLATQLNDNELIADICNFEKHAKEVEGQYSDRESRNFSIHYDQEPIKVYDDLEKISEDYEVKRASAFFGVLIEMLAIVTKYLVKFEGASFIPITNDDHFSLRTMLNNFMDKDNRLFNFLGDQITSLSERLDKIVADCRKPGFINNALKEKLNLDDSFLAKMLPMIESIHPGVHIHFIYLDLASAIRAYLSSDFYLEKQMNLRRINIVVYEGFKHIYGYTDKDYNESFWKKNIYSILENSTDQNLKDSLADIEVKLKELSEDSDINNEILREISVHYRYKERDNVIPLYHTLLDLNPSIEMNKALTLIKILPRLLEMNTSSVGEVYKTEKEKIKESNNAWHESLDNMVAQFEGYNPSEERKRRITEMINKIKGITQI